ncbi:MAG: glycoside hydrolase family 2 protein, partial [Oricola sp.]
LKRTTLLGHMPGWCPEVHAVGPWRPVSLVWPDGFGLVVERLKATLDEDGNGFLAVLFRVETQKGDPVLSCAGVVAKAERRADGGWAAELRIAGVAPWWPHTHGEPALHEVSLEVDGVAFDLGRTGFRRIEVDRGPDGKGFGLRINGWGVFCRGAVWSNADIMRLPGDRESYRPWLELAAEAGMNMLRIGGTMAYESPEFFALCDELGLMVWQDFMFANYDYPVSDEAFAETVRAEARQFLHGIATNPSLAVLCGGSEICQQGAMLGLPEERWKGPLTEEILPDVCAEHRPDVPYVPNSPCGGAMPFSPNEGIAHYYGVGAYRRPLEDARRANVRFAGECLAFSNVPQQRTLDAHLPVMPGHDPRWKERVPRDRGVGWDFEDVRDHYFQLLYGIDLVDMRYGDPARYLDLSRAVSGEVMEATFAEWRRAASSCRGALAFTYQDLLPGAGWGVVDSTGEPKPAWYALKRAFRPLQVTLTDEGNNGLSVHAINETNAQKDVVLTLACLRDGTTPVVSGRRELTLGPRANMEIVATDLFGAFFDTTYAYRFGPPSHDVTVARFIDPATGA